MAWGFKLNGVPVDWGAYYGPCHSLGEGFWVSGLRQPHALRRRG